MSAICAQRNSAASPAGRIFLPDTNQFLMITDQLLILLSPGIRSPAIRIRKAADARLVAVIDGRRAVPGHHQGHCLTENGLGYSFLRRFAAQLIYPSHLMVGAGQEPGMIVVGKLVHGNQEGLACKGAGFLPQRVQERLRVIQKRRLTAIAVLLHAGQVPGDGLHKGIVIHDGIPLASLQPGGRVPVMLRVNHRVGVGLLHILPEIPPEFVVKLWG